MSNTIELEVAILINDDIETGYWLHASARLVHEYKCQQKWARICIRQNLTNDWHMRRQLIPGLVVRPSDIKAKTRPWNEATLDVCLG